MATAHASPLGWEAASQGAMTLAKSTVWEGRFLRLLIRDGWEYVQRSTSCGVVCIVALTDGGELVLLEQFRPPIQAAVLELPAGLAGDGPGQEGEPLLAAARRELLEETGYQAKKWQPLFEGLSTPGLTDESISFFLATGLKRVGPGGGDGSERIRVHTVPVTELTAWVQARLKEGKKLDLKVELGAGVARQVLGLSGPGQAP